MLPYVIGAVLVVQFIALGVWQIDREKQAFTSQAGFAAWSNGMDVRSFQKLKVTGHFDGDHQFLLENIIINSRYGYYVLTPLVLTEDMPLLIINRGWFERTGPDVDAASLELPAKTVTVRGRAGSLPRAGYRMGDAVTPSAGWPKRAVYPALDDIAQIYAYSVKEWGRRTANQYRSYIEAALDRLKENPDHPGAAHYTIHAF